MEKIPTSSVYSVSAEGYSRSVYSGGEVKVTRNQLTNLKGEYLRRIQSSDDLVGLLLFSDILTRAKQPKEKLVIPYLPYARQDRITDALGDFGLYVFSELVNGLGFKEVVCFDPHSVVAAALIKNLKEVRVDEIVSSSEMLLSAVKTSVLIAPDVGASKRVSRLADTYSVPFVCATKQRDPLTGVLSNVEIYGDVHGKECLIVDDICDGGRTFVNLSCALRARGANRVSLYVTHGIFSQGLSVFEGLIERIYTTDTFLSATTTGRNFTSNVDVLVQQLDYERF